MFPVTKTHIITLNLIHPTGGKQVGLLGKAIGLIGETRRSHGNPLVVEVGLYVEFGRKVGRNSLISAPQPRKNSAYNDLTPVFCSIADTVGEFTSGWQLVILK